MRVGVNTLFYIPGEVGGSETYLRQTLRAVAGNFPDLELLLFTHRGNEETLRDDLGAFGQVSFERLDFHATSRWRRIIREQTELPRVAGRREVGVLWNPGYTAPLFCPCPQVTSIHDMQYRNHPEDLTFIARMATDFLVRAACRRSRALIAVSEFSKGEIVKFTGTSPAKIHVTLEAADPSFADPLPSHVLRERLVNLLGEANPFLLIVSNTYPHKNVASAVRVFGRLTGEIPHTLVLLGQPRRGEAEVRLAAEALPDPARVVRIPYVEDGEDLRALYQGADIFLFPSLYEGFGLPVLEAMMAGAPVVTTGAASIAEVAGEEAVFFDPSGAGMAEAVKAVLGWSAEERERRVIAARRRARGFSWKRTAEETVAALRGAVE